MHYTVKKTRELHEIVFDLSLYFDDSKDDSKSDFYIRTKIYFDVDTKHTTVVQDLSDKQNMFSESIDDSITDILNDLQNFSTVYKTVKDIQNLFLDMI